MKGYVVNDRHKTSARQTQSYRAIRAGHGGTFSEWEGRATDDDGAAHRLGQHLKTKLEQGADGYDPEDVVTLSRTDGGIVLAARAKEIVERLRGWKTSPTADPDLDAE